MLLVDANRPEPVRGGARELALFLTPEPGAEHPLAPVAGGPRLCGAVIAGRPPETRSWSRPLPPPTHTAAGARRRLPSPPGCPAAAGMPGRGALAVAALCQTGSPGKPTPVLPLPRRSACAAPRVRQAPGGGGKHPASVSCGL
nr:breast carcinoma-amplified sequence 4 isoform X7 [Manis javanica]